MKRNKEKVSAPLYETHTILTQGFYPCSVDKVITQVMISVRC